MSLDPCKVCKNPIAGEADTCPRCGIDKPAVPYAFEAQQTRLLDEMRSCDKQVIEYSEKYSFYMGRFLWYWRFNKEVDHYVRLENEARRRIDELVKELRDLHYSSNVSPKFWIFE